MNEKFIMALREAMYIDCERVLNNLPDVEPNFSLEFEKKMQKLIKRRSHSYYPLIATAGRRAACIIAAVIIIAAAPLSVKAVRDAVKEFVIKIFSDHHNVAVSTIAENAPETIEEVYTIDVPEGFELTEELVTDGWVNQIYKKEDKYIDLTQVVLSMFHANIDTETTTMEILIEDGIEYQLYNYENSYRIIWKYDGYVFSVYSNLNKYEFAELCKSTKLK